MIPKLLATTVNLTILDSISIKDGLAYIDIVLYGSAISSNYTSLRSRPNASTLYLILALRFQRAIHSISRSAANNSNGLLLVINQQIKFFKNN